MISFILALVALVAGYLFTVDSLNVCSGPTTGPRRLSPKPMG